jgi:hypothetical protein
VWVSISHRWKRKDSITCLIAKLLIAPKCLFGVLSPPLQGS